MHTSFVRRLPRLTPLAACLGLSLCVEPAMPREAARLAPLDIIVVTNCNDSGDGSLRAAVAVAMNGDVIDLTQLPCSTITLTTGAISVTVNSLRLMGPEGHPVTIDGGATEGFTDRVLKHSGMGTLRLDYLVITSGANISSLEGGCIYSAGSVNLYGTTVSSCSLVPEQAGGKRGGGICVVHDLGLYESRILGNLAGVDQVYGGGAYVGGSLSATRSTISGNVIEGGRGAGAFVTGDASIKASTIDDNYTSDQRGTASNSVGGGMFLVGLTGTSTIADSTISSNSADQVGGLFSIAQLTLSNSTIAFNQAALLDNGPYRRDAGLHVQAPTELSSTIVSNNLAGGVAADVSTYGLLGNITGANDLVLAPEAGVDLPAGTIVGQDPLLYPLAGNGGATRTHGLMPGSPAIDTGNDAAGEDYDQRGVGFARVVGAFADIGAFESQGPGDGDTLFRDGFDGS